jgi:hypothetical protein
VLIIFIMDGIDDDGCCCDEKQEESPFKFKEVDTMLSMLLVDSHVHFHSGFLPSGLLRNGTLMLPDVARKLVCG